MYSDLKVDFVKDIEQLEWTESKKEKLKASPVAWLADSFDEINEKYLYYSFFYKSDDRWVKGFLAEPKEKSELRPVVIYNRGGTMDVGQISMMDLLSPNAFLGFLREGYVVITTQYSGNDGSEGKDEYGGMDLNDVLNLKQIIDAYHVCDPNRIVMYGGSRGGTMCYLALARADWIKSAAVIAGVTNIERQLANREEMKERLAKMFDIKNEDEIKKRSPIYSVNKFDKNCPVLIMHGTADWRVNPLDSYEMGIKLLEQKHPHQLVMYRDDDHGLSANRAEATKMILNWFKKAQVSKNEDKTKKETK